MFVPFRWKVLPTHFFQKNFEKNLRIFRSFTFFYILYLFIFFTFSVFFFFFHYGPVGKLRDYHLNLRLRPTKIHFKVAKKLVRNFSKQLPIQCLRAFFWKFSVFFFGNFRFLYMENASENVFLVQSCVFVFQNEHK